MAVQLPAKHRSHAGRPGALAGAPVIACPPRDARGPGPLACVEGARPAVQHLQAAQHPTVAGHLRGGRHAMSMMLAGWDRKAGMCGRAGTHAWTLHVAVCCIAGCKDWVPRCSACTSACPGCTTAGAGCTRASNAAPRRYGRPSAGVPQLLGGRAKLTTGAAA